MKTFAIGWHGCGTLFDFEAKERELGDLEQQMASASFWDDKEKSQATVQQLKAVKEIVDPLRQFQQSFEDVEVLAELADEESDEETAAEAQKEALMRQILTNEARQRLARVRMVRPDFAAQLELQLIQVAQSGRVAIPIDDDTLKRLLAQLQAQQSKREIKITRR